MAAEINVPVPHRDTLSPGLASMVMTFAVMMLDALGWTIRMVSELESDSVALERLREYEMLPSEGAWDTEELSRAGQTPPLPGDWPADGTIQFKEYSTRHAEWRKFCFPCLW